MVASGETSVVRGTRCSHEARLITRSILVPVHPGRKEAFMRRPQRGDGYRAAIRQSQILSAGGAETHGGDAGGFGSADKVGMVGDCDQVSRLVLSEPEGVA